MFVSYNSPLINFPSMNEYGVLIKRCTHHSIDRDCLRNVLEIFCSTILFNWHSQYFIKSNLTESWQSSISDWVIAFLHCVDLWHDELLSVDVNKENVIESPSSWSEKVWWQHFSSHIILDVFLRLCCEVRSLLSLRMRLRIINWDLFIIRWSLYWVLFIFFLISWIVSFCWWLVFRMLRKTTCILHWGVLISSYISLAFRFRRLCLLDWFIFSRVFT